MPGLCVAISKWLRIFENIVKGSSGEEQMLEYSTHISILSFPGTATIRLVQTESVAWLLCYHC